MATTESFKIGIDVGGTFTDFFCCSAAGRVETHKSLSTPTDPSIGVLDGLQALAETHGLTLAEFAARLETIVHGTTVTTNAVLTRSGARTALLTTAGVRDALEMRRGLREERYDNRCTNVEPLVPRHRRRAIRGRLDYRGAELTPLDAAAVAAEARALRDQGVQAVAICFMNAFADRRHEDAAAAIVRRELPGLQVSASVDVLPVVRFYPRVSTTVLSAYVGPVLGRYLEALQARLAAAGFRGVLLIMQSSGGVALPATAIASPASTLLSGPAGGPGAAASFTRPHGREDGILVDMGGTSFDASLVRGGRATTTTEGTIARLTIALPMLDITTIGAGGGSIGWIDAGGLLRMGPSSAGADPGPACYGRGGERPTCTDANLLLGFLDPLYFAGGRMRLDTAAARAAIERGIARPLGLSVEQAAAGMYRVINANMAHGVREVTVKRGLDPREFPLVVAGGAGPLHACMIAHELEIPEVLVPASASTFCATGMLLGDLEHEQVRSLVAPLRELDQERLRALVRELSAAGETQLAREGLPPERRQHAIVLELRYRKQYHEVALPVSAEVVRAGDWAELARLFHAEHNRLFGYDLAAEGTDLELINVRVRSIGRTLKPALPRVAAAAAGEELPRKGQRLAFLPEHGEFAHLPVYDGHRLRAGQRLAGPALVERADTTIVVTPSFDAAVDELGGLMLRRREGSQR